MIGDLPNFALSLIKIFASLIKTKEKDEAEMTRRELLAEISKKLGTKNVPGEEELESTTKPN
jgi:hypothetical protein